MIHEQYDKKRELDFSYWLTLQNRVLDHGFVTIAMNQTRAKQFWLCRHQEVQEYIKQF